MPFRYLNTSVLVLYYRDTSAVSTLVVRFLQLVVLTDTERHISYRDMEAGTGSVLKAVQSRSDQPVQPRSAQSPSTIGRSGVQSCMSSPASSHDFDLSDSDLRTSPELAMIQRLAVTVQDPQHPIRATPHRSEGLLCLS